MNPVSRRDFVVALTSAGGGLLLGFRIRRSSSRPTRSFASARTAE